MVISCCQNWACSMITRNIINIMNKIFICLLIMAEVLTGCTRYENPQPNFEDYELEDADGGIKRKVLVIAVDGLVGLELKKEVPANLSAMLQNAKYSYEGIADENTSDPASWTTLMTGVSVKGLSKKPQLRKGIPDTDKVSGIFLFVLKKAYF